MQKNMHRCQRLRIGSERLRKKTEFIGCVSDFGGDLKAGGELISEPFKKIAEIVEN